MKAYHLILSAYPISTVVNENVVGPAVVGCWVRHDLASSVDDAVELAKKQLNEEWIVDRLIEAEVIGAEVSQKDNKDGGKELFEEALRDGFSAHIQRCPREVIAPFDDFGPTIADRSDLSKLRKANWYCLISEIDKQWANGVTPNEDDFLPLWVENPPNDSWRDFWPEHTVTTIDQDELISNVLPSLVDEDFCVGVSRANSAMPIFLAAELLDALESD